MLDLAIPNRPYEDALWAASLRREVQGLAAEGGWVGLVGHLILLRLLLDGDHAAVGLPAGGGDGFVLGFNPF